MRNASVHLTALVAATLLSGCLSDGPRTVDGRVSNGVGFAAGAEGEPSRVPLFVASTRRGEGVVDEGRAHFSLTAIGIPQNHQPGAIEKPSFGSPERTRHFTVLSKSNMDEGEFFGQVAAHVSGRVGSSRDILLYVHGFNTSHDEARFRLAQIVADGGFAGVPVLFSWNSRGGLFNYESDKEAATVSRDALQRTVLELAKTPGVGRVHILAHSMGAWLTMETLRDIAIAGHPDLDGRLGQVMLANPDIDINVFRQQISRIDPGHVSLYVAKKRSRAEPLLAHRGRAAEARGDGPREAGGQGRTRPARRLGSRHFVFLDGFHRPWRFRRGAQMWCAASAPASRRRARRTRIRRRFPISGVRTPATPRHPRRRRAHARRWRRPRCRRWRSGEDG